MTSEMNRRSTPQGHGWLEVSDSRLNWLYPPLRSPADLHRLVQNVGLRDSSVVQENDLVMTTRFRVSKP